MFNNMEDGTANTAEDTHKADRTDHLSFSMLNNVRDLYLELRGVYVLVDFLRVSLVTHIFGSGNSTTSYTGQCR